MSARLQENIVAGLVLCVFVGYLGMSLDLGPNARLVPLPFAALGLVLIVAQLIRQNLGIPREPHGQRFGPPARRPAGLIESAEASEPGENGRRELQAVGFVAVFVALISLLGPLPAVFAFSAGYLVLSKHYVPGKAFAVAAGFTAIMYLLFVVGLKLQLYHGILAPLLDP